MLSGCTIGSGRLESCAASQALQTGLPSVPEAHSIDLAAAAMVTRANCRVAQRTYPREPAKAGVTRDDLSEPIDLVEEGDRIKIDIPARSISLVVDEATLAKRREAMLARKSEAWKPRKRSRRVSMALKAYAALTTSAARGAVRIVPE